MTESISVKIMGRLRSEADQLGRPDVRHATLDRLEVACNAIADGSARAIVKKGNPDAYAKWRAPDLKILPPRIEEYVLARRALDQRDGCVPSTWSGPVASSLRKEGGGMLAYVRAREDERGPQGASVMGKRTPLEWWHLVDGIEDDSLKARLMRALSEGREAKGQVAALKAAVRLCSATFDIEAYLRGDHAVAEVPLAIPSPGSGVPIDLMSRLVGRLTSSERLAAFDLEYDGNRVRQRSTKDTLVESQELAALRALVGEGS